MKLNTDGTINWDDVSNRGLMYSLETCYEINEYGCWAWIKDGPGLKLGIIHRYLGKQYIVDHCYCYQGGRIWLCVNPDHVAIGGNIDDGR